MSDTLIGCKYGTEGKLSLLQIKLKIENSSSNHSLCWVYGCLSTQPSSSESSKCGFSKLSLKLSVILWDHKIRKSGLKSESQTPRHAYMSSFRGNSECETSMIKKIIIIITIIMKNTHRWKTETWMNTHNHIPQCIILKTTSHLLLSTVLLSLLCNSKERKKHQWK